MDEATFGQLVRERRKALGLTQEQLAERSGVPQPTISRIEGDRADPRRTTAERLTEALSDEATFGQLVRERRKALGLTQEQLAERSGVPQPTISRIEGDRADPRRTTAERLTEALSDLERPAATSDAG